MKFKLNIVNKFKIWVTITLLVLVVGLILFGVIGFNQSIEYNDAYEVDIKIYSLDKSETFAKEAIDNYFKNNNITYKQFNLSNESDDYAILKYKFASDVSSSINVDTLKAEVKTKLNENNIDLEVKDLTVNEVENVFFGNAGFVSLALGLSVVAIFVYLFFMEKWQSALSVVGSGIISALLFISMMAITRIPANPFVWAVEIASTLLCASISSGLTARFREETKKDVFNKEQSIFKQIANSAVDASFLRYVVVSAFLLVGSILMIAIGKGNFKFLGLQIFVASIVAIFSSIVWTPILWCLIKKDKNFFTPQAKSSKKSN